MDKKPVGVVIAINNLMDDYTDGSKHRALLKGADVIFGRDVDSQRIFLVYGRDALERVRRRNKAEKLAAVTVDLDQDSDELEWLCAAVKTLKGKHDYQGGGKN